MDQWLLAAVAVLLFLLFAVIYIFVVHKRWAKRGETRQLQMLFHTSFDGILLVNQEKKVLAANPSFLDMSDFQQEELLGREFCIITGCDKRFHAKECPGHCLVLRTIRQGGSLPYLETRMARKNGSLVPVAITVTSSSGKDGNFEAAIIIRNLTVEKGLTKKLSKQLKKVRSGQGRLEALLQLGLELSSIADFDQRIQSVIEKIRKVLRADLAGLLLAQSQDGYWQWKALSGNCSSEFKDRVIALEDGQLRERMESGQLIGDKDPLGAAEAEMFAAAFLIPQTIKIKAFLGVPVKFRGRVIGILCVAHRKGYHFSRGQVQMLSILANQVAVSVENEALWQRIENQITLRERRWLAGEIHDGLAQVVAQLQSQIKDIAYLLEDGQSGKAENRLSRLTRLADTAYQETRQVIFSLNTTAEPEGDFITALDEYLSEFSLQHQIEVQLIRIDKDIINMASNVETQLMRIIQEALANIGKHADATQVRVEFSRWGKRHLRVTIADNGIGFDVSGLQSKNMKHYGLRIMRERATSVGGKLSVESTLGRGTVVTVQVPCEIGLPDTDSERMVLR